MNINIMKKFKAGITSPQNRKAVATFGLVGLAAASPAAMAIDQATADTVVAAVLAGTAISIAAGYAVFVVIKAAKIGIMVLSSFLSRGARA